MLVHYMDFVFAAQCDPLVTINAIVYTVRPELAKTPYLRNVIAYLTSDAPVSPRVVRAHLLIACILRYLPGLPCIICMYRA